MAVSCRTPNNWDSPGPHSAPVGGRTIRGRNALSGVDVVFGGFLARTREELGWQEERGRDTLLVKRTLRSGQRVGYPGNVVVLGDVNAGGEVVAGGDIIVLGWLRGTAHAGAAGDEKAVVAAFRLWPTQIRIGDVAGRPPDEGGTPPSAPELARVREGDLVIERCGPRASARQPALFTSI